jgi:hypothetical protein
MEGGDQGWSCSGAPCTKAIGPIIGVGEVGGALLTWLQARQGGPAKE